MMKQGTLRVAILLVCVTLMATVGCIPGLPDIPGLPGGEEPEEPEIEPALKGTSWVLEAYGEPGNLTPALAGTDVTLEFLAIELNGNAGCNSYFGSYTSKTDGSLEVNDLANTEMACMEPGVMNQETEYLTTLRQAENYVVVGATLRIIGGGRLLVLARSEGAPGPEQPPEEEPPEEEPPVEQPPLKDTSWVLDAYGEPGNLTPAISGNEPTIDFATDELNGSAGCNAYFGSYTSSTDGSFEVSSLGNTDMYCTEESVRDQERAFLEALAAANEYEVVGGKLRIEGGGEVLLLEETEEAPPPVEQPPLKNTSWELEAYGTPGHLTAAIPGKEPTLTFKTGDVNGSGGCNSFFGTYTSDTEGTLEITSLGSTMILCTNVNVMNQEHAFLDALGDAETYEVVGEDLRIQGGGKVLLLVESEEEPAPVEQPPLKNTSWELEAYGTPSHLTAAIPGKEPTIDFSTSEVNGSGGCNSYFGSYTSDTDGSLEIYDIGSTMMLCMDEDIRDQEQAFLEALAAADNYEVVGGKLRITGAGKMLVFTH